MPYTLAKFFLWGLLMALAGGVIGWLLRSLKCRAEVARVHATAVDDDELDRLRGRLANLEPVVAERDRLRMELADVRGSTAGALGFASVPDTSIIPDEPHAELSETSELLGVDDAVVAAVDETAVDQTPVDETPAERQPDLDLSEAASVLGKKIRLDDLTIVEGIGPKISELCNSIGITTWSQLAAAEVDTLQSMLNDAGSRFQMHKPGSWPRQAGLLAIGQWAEFQQLTDELSGGT